MSKKENITGESSNGRKAVFETVNVRSIRTSPSISKVCTQCDVDKPLEDFAKKAKGPMGRSSDCKACHQKVSKANYVGNVKEQAM